MSKYQSPNLDDLINGITPTPEIEKEIEQEADDSSPEAETRDIDDSKKEQDTSSDEDQEAQDLAAKSEDEAKPEEVAAGEKDDYGNPIEKARTYTEDEVQRMIRDRLSRGNHNITPQQQVQVQKAAESFTADPNNPDDWQSQLKNFMKETINEMSQEEKTREYQARETQKQADFESKFSLGMEKYQDFRKVVTTLPVTDAIMLGARDLKDPAAFIYAACKTQPDEIKRIASLPDPIQQAVEVGRLHERMLKLKNVSKLAAPLSPTKSDTSAKYVPKKSIDDLIHKHAKSRVR